MTKFKIITLFPDFIDSIKEYSIIKRAVANGLIKIETIDLRKFGLGKYKQVDDKPFGGGVGMLLRVDVVNDALKSTTSRSKKNRKTVLLSPQGEHFNQQMSKDMAELDEIILICGHYEGFDHRIRSFVDKEISIGPYILTGGEIPAMVLIDSISRLKEGVLGKTQSHMTETFSVIDKKQIIEYPQYTKPRIYKGKKVPDILLSGNHKEIEAWKSRNTKKLP